MLASAADEDSFDTFPAQAAVENISNTENTIKKIFFIKTPPSRTCINIQIIKLKDAGSSHKFKTPPYLFSLK